MTNQEAIENLRHLGVLLALWLWLDPEIVGKWQAKAEYAFILEAERIGMWSE